MKPSILPKVERNSPHLLQVRSVSNHESARLTIYLLTYKNSKNCNNHNKGHLLGEKSPLGDDCITRTSICSTMIDTTA